MENYHIFSMIRMGFMIKKHVQHVLKKKNAPGKELDLCLKIRFLALVQ